MRLADVGASFNVTAMALSSDSSDIIFAGTVANGIYKSNDGGGSWIPMNNTLPGQGNDLRCRALLIDPIHSSTVYAAFRDLGIYQTTDGGESWSEVSSGLSAEAKENITVLAISPDEPRFLFAGTDGQGIWSRLLKD